MASGQKVLLCLDGSKESEDALSWYVSKLHQPNNTVYAATCVDHRPDVTNETAWMRLDHQQLLEEFGKKDKRADQILDRHKRLLEESKVANTDALKLTGEPGHVLCEEAKRKNVDYIVAGSRGLGTVRKTLLGSVSDYLVNHSNIPVVICKKEVDPKQTTDQNIIEAQERIYT